MGKKSNHAYGKLSLASRNEHTPINFQKYNARCKKLLVTKVASMPCQGVWNSVNPFCSCITAGSTQIAKTTNGPFSSKRSRLAAAMAN